MTKLESALAALEIANKRIDELEKYNLDLANESFNKSNMIDYERVKNAELAAQVSLLRASMSDALKMHNAEVFTKDSWGFCFDEFEAILDATPAQCLLEVKAEAGRAGFVEGVYWVTSCEFPISKTIAANQYANKIREGKQ